MVQDRSEPDDADSATAGADDPLAGLRRLAGLARDLGLTDVSSFTEMLDAARSEGRGAEFFKSLRTLLVDQTSVSGDAKSSLSDLGERLASWAASSTAGSSTSGSSTPPRASNSRAPTPGGAPSGPPPSGTWVSSGRETRTEGAGGQAGTTEAALLRRIEELSRAATVEELARLAAAYADVSSVHGGGSRPSA